MVTLFSYASLQTYMRHCERSVAILKLKRDCFVPRNDVSRTLSFFRHSIIVIFLCIGSHSFAQKLVLKNSVSEQKYKIKFRDVEFITHMAHDNDFVDALAGEGVNCTLGADDLIAKHGGDVGA